MNGQNILDLITNILGGETIDPTFGLSLVELARLDYESRRPWQALKAKQITQTVSAGLNPTTAYPLPVQASPTLANPSFMRMLNEGKIKLVNQSNTQQYLILDQVPFENQVEFQTSPAFYIDYANQNLYILGNIPFAALLYLFFIADLGAITVGTKWNGFQYRQVFSHCLAFQSAARYRLGTDYDDIAARNGDDNFKAAETVYRSMVAWDRELALSSVETLNRGAKNGGANGNGMWPRSSAIDTDYNW